MYGYPPEDMTLGRNGEIIGEWSTKKYGVETIALESLNQRG